MLDYKKFIKSREMRIAILRFLHFIPDKTMIKIQYRLKTGRKLNIKNPQRYTEKMQWLKLYYRDPDIVRCTDKYEVRQFVKEKGLESILNKCYGVFDRVEDIDFNKLPESFVAKDTLGSAGVQVIVIDDKKKTDLKWLMSEMDKWVKTPINVKDDGREWAYQVGKPHRIIIEEKLESDKNKGGLIDYKFFCYKGQPRYLYVVADRKLGSGAGLGIYDANYVRLPCQRLDEKPLNREIPVPINYVEMLEVAERLSKSFVFTRVDLYNQDGKIVFGEISFFDGSGYMIFSPDEYDYILGEDIDLELVKCQNRKIAE